MTASELLWLLLRRWYLVVVGMALTLIIVWPLSHRPGVYWGQVQVVLVPPTYEYFPNRLEDPQYSLTALAGVLVTEYNGEDPPVMMSSSDTTLFGEGLRSGTEVRMVNIGNQWQPVYATARIDVQAVDDDPAKVTRSLELATSDLAGRLEERQSQLGVATTMRAYAIASPSHPSVYYITGSRMRVLGAGALVGAVVTIAAVYWGERLTSWWRLHRRTRTVASARAKSVDAPTGTPTTVGR